MSKLRYFLLTFSIFFLSSLLIAADLTYALSWNDITNFVGSIFNGGIPTGRVAQPEHSTTSATTKTTTVTHISTSTTTATQGCTNHAQCSQACTSSCPAGVYGCCSGCNIGQCNVATGTCYCSNSPSYCSSPVYQVGTQCYYATTTTTTHSTSTTTNSPIQYEVCTYANPNNINGGFYLNGILYKDGQRAPVIADGVTKYTLSPAYVSGYQFNGWSGTNGVMIASWVIPNTTVTFSNQSWDGTCVGNLNLRYQNITGALPDLTMSASDITFFTFSDSHGSNGVELNFVIHNLGNVSSPPPWLLVYDNNVTVSNFNPNYDVPAYGQISTGFGYYPSPGFHTIRVVIDPNNNIAESNKNNNIAEKTINTSATTTSTTTTSPPSQCVFGTVTATSAASFNGYYIYSDQGSNGNWARILIKDSSGNTLSSNITNQGDERDYPTLGMTVKVEKVRALQDGTIVGTDIAYGNVGCTDSTLVNAFPVQGVTAYDYNSPQNIFASNLNGIEVQDFTSFPNLHILNVNQAYDRTYILFGAEMNGTYPIYLGGFDSSAGKVLVYSGNAQYLNLGQSFSFTISTGTDFSPSDTILITAAAPGSSSNSVIAYFGSSQTNYVVAKFMNTTTTWSSIQPPSFRLGNLGATAEANEVTAIINGTSQNIGTQTGFVQTDLGWTVVNPSSSSLSDMFAAIIPLSSTGTHDVAVTGLYIYCDIAGSGCENDIHANQQFTVKVIVDNFGNYPETGNVTLSACVTTGVINPFGGGGGAACLAIGSASLNLGTVQGSTEQVYLFNTSLASGYYNLQLVANVADDQNTANNNQNFYVYIFPTYNNYTVNFKSGWNLFSIQVQYAADSNSDCVPLSPIYAMYNGIYYQTTYTSGGSGYWVQMSTDCTATVTGPDVAVNDFQYLYQGWNLIGAPSKQVTFSDVIGSCNVTKGPLWYDPTSNSYVPSSVLTPGKGYFLQVSNSCQLGSGLPPPLPQ